MSKKRCHIYLRHEFYTKMTDIQKDLCCMTYGETVEQMIVDREIDKEKIKSLTQKVRLLSEKIERQNLFS